LFPNDKKLRTLHKEECNTANLSPWEGIAVKGEAMNHDEFVRRLLTLQPLGDVWALRRHGSRYLGRVRRIDERARAASIASYENGGLNSVFSAMLRAPSWQGAGQLAFRHFLEKHISFDSSPRAGHGALCRHIQADDSILPLWTEFEEIIRHAVPAFAKSQGANRRPDA
jgi:hypothetical protein